MGRQLIERLSTIPRVESDYRPFAAVSRRQYGGVRLVSRRGLADLHRRQPWRYRAAASGRRARRLSLPLVLARPCLGLLRARRQGQRVLRHPPPRTHRRRAREPAARLPRLLAPARLLPLPRRVHHRAGGASTARATGPRSCRPERRPKPPHVTLHHRPLCQRSLAPLVARRFLAGLRVRHQGARRGGLRLRRRDRRRCAPSAAATPSSRHSPAGRPTDAPCSSRVAPSSIPRSAPATSSATM